MRKRQMRWIATVAALLLFCSLAAHAAEITVAAAADLQFALREIAQNYEKKSGNTVKLTFGSSGALATQIQNGAPFDVFFSADAAYPERLVKANAADGATIVRYARGVLVLWIANGQTMSGSIGGLVTANLNDLLASGITKIAIANPQHAPYGRAAVEALQKAGIYDKVSAKFITGENVSQAAQFAESGNAQAALIPLSLAMTPALVKQGRYLPIDRNLYAPIVQAAVVTSHAKDGAAAREFLKFVVTLGAQTLRKYGFEAYELNPPPVPGGAQ